MTGLPLPLYATTTGGRTPPGYCPRCLDLWGYGRTEDDRKRTHPTCRDALDAIWRAPSATWEVSAA